MRQPWFSNLEMQALIERAYRCCVDVLATTGAPPDHFMVTEAEYLLLCPPELCRMDGVARDQVSIFGIRVYGPDGLPLYVPRPFMEPTHITSRILDSERSSFEDWAAGVDRLLLEVTDA